MPRPTTLSSEPQPTPDPRRRASHGCGAAGSTSPPGGSVRVTARARRAPSNWSVPLTCGAGHCSRITPGALGERGSRRRNRRRGSRDGPPRRRLPPWSVATQPRPRHDLPRARYQQPLFLVRPNCRGLLQCLLPRGLRCARWAALSRLRRWRVLGRVIEKDENLSGGSGVRSRCGHS